MLAGTYPGLFLSSNSLVSTFYAYSLTLLQAGRHEDPGNMCFEENIVWNLNQSKGIEAFDTWFRSLVRSWHTEFQAKYRRLSVRTSSSTATKVKRRILKTTTNCQNFLSTILAIDGGSLGKVHKKTKKAHTCAACDHMLILSTCVFPGKCCLHHHSIVV